MREIQQSHGSTGHDSVEDARAALDLVKQKCEKGPRWGTSEASSEPIFKRLARVWHAEAEAEARAAAATTARADSEMTVADEEQNDAVLQTNEDSGKRTDGAERNNTKRRRCAIVDWGDQRRGFGAQADVIIGCRDDDEVVRGVKSILSSSKDESRQNLKGIEDIFSKDDNYDEERNNEGPTTHKPEASPPPPSSPSSNVTFVWARLRELEAFRGWWNSNRSNGNAHTNKDRFSPTSPPLPPTTPQPHSTSASVSETNNPAVAQSATLFSATSKTVSDIATIHASLPPRTAFIVYSGSGDPRETARLQAQQQTFKREYSNLKKKWDELSTQWTDVEEKQLREACAKARRGIGFVGVVT